MKVLGGKDIKKIILILIMILSFCSIAFAEDGAEDYVITAYCSCYECCGEWAVGRIKVIGSAGIPLREGIHVASAFEAGTEIEIQGLGTYISADTPAEWILNKYSNRVIDIYFENHENALNFGKRTMKVYVS